MLESYVEMTVTILYVIGIFSLFVSIAAYLFLPKALKILFEEEEEIWEEVRKLETEQKKRSKKLSRN
jgi:F0F1-type ATP synthase membrane subunit b/b'